MHLFQSSQVIPQSICPKIDHKMFHFYLNASKSFQLEADVCPTFARFACIRDIVTANSKKCEGTELENLESLMS